MIKQAELQGHWRRLWIKTPEREDHTSHVHWIQCEDDFVDIRIPAYRPDVSGVTCLAELLPRQLLGLMAAEGFAGHITVSGDRCTWHRTLNWHGQPAAPDVGTMSFDENGHLIEDGVHAEYRELWQSQWGDPFQAQRFSCGTQFGILITNTTQFLLAIGPERQGSTQGLTAALQQGRTDMAGMEVHFRSEYVLGRWIDGQGVATISTNPLREGHTILTREAAGGYAWHWMGFTGRHGAERMIAT